MTIPDKNHGFTLIELMIAVAIVGILASIVYPSYQNSIRQAHRADAQVALVSLANDMEKQYTQTSSYVGLQDRTTDYYTVTINATSTSYVLTATPIDGSSQANDACGSLTLDNFGQKGAAMNSGCW